MVDFVYLVCNICMECINNICNSHNNTLCKNCTHIRISIWCCGKQYISTNTKYITYLNNVNTMLYTTGDTISTKQIK